VVNKREYEAIVFVDSFSIIFTAILFLDIIEIHAKRNKHIYFIPSIYNLYKLHYEMRLKCKYEIINNM
jgi:hypothetical protein